MTIEAQPAARTIDVAGVLENRRFDGFNIRLVLISWLITVCDGFDMMVVSFTAPYIRDEIGLTVGELASIFSSGLLGMTLGGLVFSAISDRIGRRPVVVATAFTFALLTFATGFVQSFEQFLVLRFVDGLALGGMVPIAWALNVEFVPRRYRATVITVIMIGYSVGTSGSGPLTVLVEPLIGWRGLYWAGGLASLFSAALLALWLPESLRFLVSHDRSPGRVAAMVNRLQPAAQAVPEDRFVLGDEQGDAVHGRFRDLFAGRLRILTPVLWLGFMASSIAIYFVNSWGPIVLEAMAFERNTAALATAFGGIMGSVAGLAIMRPTDRWGAVTVTFYPVILLPIMLVLGLVALPASTVLILAMVVLMLVGGMHFAIMSIIGGLYPTNVRGRGSGWCSSVGKLGGVLGPALGGLLLSSGMPVIRSYVVLAVCPALVLICGAIIARYNGAGGLRGDNGRGDKA